MELNPLIYTIWDLISNPPHQLLKSTWLIPRHHPAQVALTGFVEGFVTWIFGEFAVAFVVLLAEQVLKVADYQLASFRLTLVFQLLFLLLFGKFLWFFELLLFRDRLLKLNSDLNRCWAGVSNFDERMKLFVSGLFEAKLAKIKILASSASVHDIFDWFLLAFAALHLMENIIVFFILLTHFFFLLLLLQRWVQLFRFLLLRQFRFLLSLLYFLSRFLLRDRLDLFRY